MRAAIRASPVAHADATGSREDGKHGGARALSTPTARRCGRGTRAKAARERERGPAVAGVPVGGCDVACTDDAGRHRCCRARPRRAIHDPVGQRSRAAGVRGRAGAVQALVTRARAVAGDAPGERRQAAPAFQAEVRALRRPYLPAPTPPTPADDTAPVATAAPARAPEGATPRADPVPPQRPPCQRSERHPAAPCVVAAAPAVPATTTAAERGLRHRAVRRRISGGTRATAGSAAKVTPAPVVGTRRAHGRTPFAACRRLLASPQS